MFANTLNSHTYSAISLKNKGFRIQIRNEQIQRLLHERRKKFQQEVQRQEQKSNIFINGETTMKVYRQIFDKIDRFIIQIQKVNCDLKVIQEMAHLAQVQKQVISIFLDWRICEMAEKNSSFKNDQHRIKLKGNEMGLILDILEMVYLNRMSAASAEWLCWILLEVVDQWRSTLCPNFEMSDVRKTLDCLSALLKNRNGMKIGEMLLDYDFGWLIEYVSGEFDNVGADVHWSVLNLFHILAISSGCSLKIAHLSKYLTKYLDSHFHQARVLSLELLHISATHNNYIDLQISYYFFSKLLQFMLSQERRLNVEALNMVYFCIKANQGLISQLVDKEDLLPVLQDRILRQYNYDNSDPNVAFCLSICSKILGVILCGYSPKKSLCSHPIFYTICQKTQQFPHTAVLLQTFNLFWEFFVPRMDDGLVEHFLGAAGCFPLDNLELIAVMKTVTKIFECLMRDEGERSEQILGLFQKNGLMKYFEHMHQ